MSSELWFISDTHFSHNNILTFTTRCGECTTCVGTGKVRMRPFSSVEEMDELMIENWNKHIRPSDKVWHLGDLTMHRQLGQIAHILKRLNGHKRIILGNHDLAKTGEYYSWFEKIASYRKIDGMMFSHIPIHPYSMGRSTANIHGHVHSNPGEFPPVLSKKWLNDGEETRTISPYVNISVEVINYTPVSLGQVKEMVEEAIANYSLEDFGEVR